MEFGTSLLPPWTPAPAQEDDMMPPRTSTDYPAHPNDPVALISGSGIVHTEECPTIKSVRAGSLNIPMKGDYTMPLQEAFDFIADGELTECRFCARIRQQRQDEDNGIPAHRRRRPRRPGAREAARYVVRREHGRYAIYSKRTSNLMGYAD